MATKYQAKGVHGSPEQAGVQNMRPEIMEKMKSQVPDEENINAKIMPIYKTGQVNRDRYKGQWTPEQLRESISDFFDYCVSIGLKPTQPGLRLWLGLHRDTIHEWRTNKAKFGLKTDILNDAFEFMEMYLQINIDKYPTGSAFLLRTSYGHVEQSKVNVETSNTDVSADGVKDMIARLGLAEEKTE